ncbi:WG repeat-containing protein [Clostridium botulinum]|uniref:WG repeat-containing protein n=1 Tax=Clostridium botulinum TaxID=1491 RepID=A0A9Q1UXX5_CLOBO|nr:WG repeat-containing protein [Clostridium botulinum]AEB77520.1 conserved hypothetical protein [Clostridium botulinum BKT015925]KEH96100.1 hypothetical protein Y848_p0096 [Clostridium botulinum C/D str. Sp77]KEH96997.1 hypothetical protein Z953_13440 [Clostridium botulinum D str. 16868]KLU74590.1 hypothetical protein CBC3_12880 [Clostridium botulinum V891]KOA75863.1 hypothetical protein ADU77_10425 [Clostridium botulinum]
MKKILKVFLVCMFMMFLTSCSNEKEISLPKDVNRISNVCYLGKNIYGIDIAPIPKGTFPKRNYKLINLKGNIISKEDIIYIDKECSFLDNGAVSVLNKDKKSMLISKDGKVIDDRYTIYSYLGNGVFAVSKNFKTGYCNSKGEDIVPPIDFMSICNVQKGDKFPYKNNEGKLGFIDTKGKTVIPFVFDGIGKYSKDANFISASKDKKWGLINKDGKTIIPFKFSWLFPCEDGNFIVELNNKCGLIDKNSKVIIPFEFDLILEIKKGTYKVLLIDKFNCNKLYGVMDNRGKTIVKPFEAFKIDYADNKNIVSNAVDDMGNSLEYTKMMHQLLDTNRKELTPDFYEEITYYKDDLFRVKNNNKYGFINRSGKVVIPVKFNNFLEFNDNFCIVDLNGKYGILDKSGHYKINPKYEDIKYLCKNSFAVKLNNKWGIVDSCDKLIKPIEYDDISSIESHIECKYNVLMKKGQKGILLKI